MVAPEWGVQRFSTRTVPESKVLPIAPMGSPPSAAHPTPWPRPRPSRGLWPEARWSDGAAPPSRPCRTGTAAPELKHSDDRPHAPWFASATQGLSVYPQPQPSGIPADPFSRSPYRPFAWPGPAPAPVQTHIRSLRGAAAPTSRLRRVRAQEDETILRIGFSRPWPGAVRPPGSAGTDQVPVDCGKGGSTCSGGLEDGSLDQNASCCILPERDQQLARQGDDHRLAEAAARALDPLAEPQGQR